MSPSASMQFRIDFSGEANLIRHLDSLKTKTRSRIIGQALRAAWRPMLFAAKANARRIKDTGLLAKSIGVTPKTYRVSGVFVGIIGPRKGFKQLIGENKRPRDPRLYAHLVEFGTKPHMIKNTRHPGAKAKPFMRPAFDKHSRGALRLFRRKAWEQIAKQVRRKAS